MNLEEALYALKEALYALKQRDLQLKEALAIIEDDRNTFKVLMEKLAQLEGKCRELSEELKNER